MKRRRVFEIPESDFRTTVASQLSITAIVHKLGFHNHSEAYEAVRDRISDLAIDTSHFRIGGRRPRRYTEAQLRDAVTRSRSIRQTLIHLGVRAEGGNYKTIQRDMQRLGLDTSHFTGKGWRRGSTGSVTRSRDLSEILTDNSHVETKTIRKRLLREGVKEHRCERCGITEWFGKPVPIELDHINGIYDDHRLENLRLLCPNCHAQTDTYRGRNKRRRRAQKATQMSIL